jgi:hypothetical protein
MSKLDFAGVPNWIGSIAWPLPCGYSAEEFKKSWDCGGPMVNSVTGEFSPGESRRQHSFARINIY